MSVSEATVSDKWRNSPLRSSSDSDTGRLLIELLSAPPWPAHRRPGWGDGCGEWTPGIRLASFSCCFLSPEIFKKLSKTEWKVIHKREVRLGLQLGYIGTKWDKSGTFSDQYFVHFGSVSQMNRKLILKQQYGLIGDQIAQSDILDS